MNERGPRGELRRSGLVLPLFWVLVCALSGDISVDGIEHTVEAGCGFVRRLPGQFDIYDFSLG